MRIFGLYITTAKKHEQEIKRIKNSNNKQLSKSMARAAELEQTLGMILDKCKRKGYKI